MSDYIPFAIQEEIMKRLPTKSLLRFRTVSKAWKSLIDSSQFVVDYSVNHTHQHHLLVSYSPVESVEKKYVSIVDDESFPEHKCSLPDPAGSGPRLLGSCQGLFCVCTTHGDPHEPGRIIKKAVLWNPSIRKSVAIDLLYELHRNSVMIIGFGVCPQTSDPKLVKINSTYSMPNLDTIIYSPWQVEVYTLSSQAWRSIPTINQPRNSISLKPHQVVIDGFIYWHAFDLVSVSMMTTGFEGYNLIVSFDMTSEEFMEVSLPDSLARAKNNNLVISKLKESLTVVEMVKEAEKLVYCMWMMEHGGPNSFTKVFNINSPDASIEVVLGFRDNDEPIFKNTDQDAHDVFVHELHSEHINCTLISCNGYSLYAGSYMETLLLLDH
ncbi:putative F-box domain-containing protein [Helianthus annuus]|nr:putative F-box domain-containing protein [Helianthus annuus]